MKNIFPLTTQILPFGSFVTELYLPNGDIDLVVIDEEKSTEELFNHALKLMNDLEEIFEEVQPISNAKIPIIKFVEKKS